ncbi:MAG: hypothetical protein ABSC77_12625 [Terracidiphilus sp.]|jgi:hypothetical protein
MGKINIGRVILGGLVAGIVADVLGFLVDGVLLAPSWAEQMKKLGQGAFSTCQLIEYNLLGLVCGIALIWIYAAIRPRFGAGVKTAIYAGLAVWVIGVLLPNLSFLWVSFSWRRLTVLTTLGGLVEIVVAAIAGAALYKESAS